MRTFFVPFRIIRLEAYVLTCLVSAAMIGLVDSLHHCGVCRDPRRRPFFPRWSSIYCSPSFRVLWVQIRNSIKGSQYGDIWRALRGYLDIINFYHCSPCARIPDRKFCCASELEVTGHCSTCSIMGFATGSHYRFCCLVQRIVSHHPTSSSVGQDV
ncbi:hypothetical protein EV421DRAFT_1162497 [Armillaria borealis]|uniref:Uncharacterized protein n=1 Tax=Armillaria borealis TaxID=47425 RepID=A0AA39JZH6_9AGAR|nr:hypothetical protein EV421DRAFT_1162497 [Armillaria borealis]